MNPATGELAVLLAQRIANVERLDTLLEVMNTINRLTLCGIISHDEYLILSSVMERTRNYLITIGQAFR